MTYHIEYQVSENVLGFELVVTITGRDSYWTSRPARLEAETWTEAHTEAGRQIGALRRTLGVFS